MIRILSSILNFIKQIFSATTIEIESIKPEKPLILMNQKQIEEIFGKFEYHDLPNGAIVIDSDWQRNNIISIEIPKLFKLLCHKKLGLIFYKIFSEISTFCLGDLDIVDTKRIGGCFVPRHMNWSKSESLSHHSWGISTDINPSSNKYGSKGNMSPRIIEIFKRDGFLWGGNWKIPDSMHFEIGLYRAKEL